MKKAYVEPSVAVVSMDMEEHLASSGSISGDCGWHWVNNASAFGSECNQSYYGNAAT